MIKRISNYLVRIPTHHKKSIKEWKKFRKLHKEKQGKIILVFMSSLVSKIKFSNNLKSDIKKAVDLIGGFNQFIKKGETVLLKPNYNTADPYPASTDLNFLKSVIESLWEIEPKSIIIGESSTYYLNTRKVLEKCRVFELEKNYDVRVLVFEEAGGFFKDDRHWIKKEIPNSKYLKSVSLPVVLDWVDKIILLSNLKTHRRARFTGALKLSVGFMKPRERIRLHMMNLEEKIAELNFLINPSLIIMDARKVFVEDGPDVGKVENPNLILASNDRVAIDIEGVKILQNYKAKNYLNLPILEIPQIKRAIELGIGNKDYILKVN